VAEKVEIPAPVKRIVRQQAGFGCCKCGFPIIQYHHIVRGSEKPEDIMLLCPNCHHEATSKAMTELEQRFYRARPVNVERGYVEGMLKVNQNAPVVNVGTNQFIGEGDFLLVDGESLLSLSITEQKLDLSMKLFDRDDQLVVEIEKNEWISGDVLPWDLECQYQHLQIRRKLRDIQLEIDARDMPIDIRADMWRKGQNFQLRPEALMFNGVVTDSGVKNLCLVALRLEANTSNKTFSIGPDPQYGSGILVAEPNIKKRIGKGLQAWKELTCDHNFAVLADSKKYSVKQCTKCGRIEKVWN